MKTIDHEVLAYVMECQKSKATTPLGQTRAIAAYRGDPYADYLSSLIPDARSEMSREMKRRTNWPQTQQEMADIPAPARYYVRGSDMPAARAAYWQARGGSTDLPDHIRAELADAAYDVADWGRLKNKNKGKNMPSAGIRTKNLGGYSAKCHFTHYEYYADYSAVLHRARLYYQLPGQTWQSAPVLHGRVRIHGKLITSPRPSDRPTPRQIVRALRRLGWIAYECGSDGDPTGSHSVAVYHPAHGHYHTFISCWADLPGFLRDAADAFRARAQHARDRRIDEMLLNTYRDYMVSVADSVRAGNCPAGTSEFARALAVGPDGPRDRITVAELLAVRDDRYTRRACIAAVRHG